MQRIFKGPEPEALTVWRQGQMEAGILPRYSDLQNPQKGACRNQLMQEQGAICCYCNMVISSEMMHIEHLVPQSIDQQMDLVWANLLGCCAPQNRKRHKILNQCHCGEFRGDKELGVTPLQQDCGDQFAYSFEGEILHNSAGNYKAQQTITNLNLTAERLQNARRTVLREAYLSLDEMNAAEWLVVYVERGPDGFPPFAGMLRWFFENSWREEQQRLSG